ncbi:MAG: response regulator transcription factor [Anaerolineaceae bacterium]|nr:response regulator transcription factor [Anaerolineaceae bacterium]
MEENLICVVDDEPRIIDFIRIYLENENFKVIGFADGVSALDGIRKEKPVLVILDIMLPKMDGFSVCKTLRGEKNEVPIIILTAKDEDIDKILGLELGADDYLTKPFNPRELVARVRAVLRRNNLTRKSSVDLINVGDITIDNKRREVRIGDKMVNLRTQEFELLRILAEEEGRVFSREQLLNYAWGYSFAGQTRTVDVHIAQLRKKLKESNTSIETITGYGYKLKA